jgi:riboflavin synthase
VFTGIVEQSVAVVNVADGPRFRRITIPNPWEDVRGGESISVNGCCLTVAEMMEGKIGFDVVLETLSRTNLGLLRIGDRVHLERSLRVGDRIDGHFVQGHVDGTARLLDKQMTPECRLRLENPEGLAKYIVQKGSVSIDGVSLTIAAIGSDYFEVALIPTTISRTELANRAIGWPFNIETDVLSKTIISWLERQEKSVEDRR